MQIYSIAIQLEIGIFIVNQVKKTIENLPKTRPQAQQTCCRRNKKIAPAGLMRRSSSA
jgi:hypothetical protein